MTEEQKETYYVILNMNIQYEICRMCPKSGLFKGTYKECEAWIKGATEATKELQEEVEYHRFQRCRECEGLHKENGNCTIVGGFYTAVLDTHCPKIKEKLELANRIRELEAQIEKMRLCEMCKNLNWQGCVLSSKERLDCINNKRKLFELKE